MADNGRERIDPNMVGFPVIKFLAMLVMGLMIHSSWLEGAWLKPRATAGGEGTAASEPGSGSLEP